MADFTVTSTQLMALFNPFGGHPGAVHLKLTLTGVTYGNGNLNILAALGGKSLMNADPTRARFTSFTIGNSTAAYLVLFTPAASPTWANLGTLKLFTATGAEASGTVTLDIWVSIFLNSQNTK